MKILITGATGFIGRRLAARLAADGHTVTGLSRNPETAAGRVPAVSRFFPWQASEQPPQDALTDIDAVIHLAGETVDGRWTAAKKRRIMDSRVNGTRNLVAALAASGRTPALVSTSAVGYYGDRGDAELTEESGSGGGFLAEVCRNWEREALAAEQAGCRVAVLRLGIVLGAGGGALPRLLPLARLGLSGRLGSGRQWWPWVHVDDVTRAFEAAALSPWSGAFNVTAPEPLRQRDFAITLARAVHRPALAPPAPAFALRLILGEFADELLFSKRVLPSRLLQAGFTFDYPRAGDALAQLVSQGRLMRTYELTREQIIPLGLPETFAFFSDARNLERLTPPWLRFQVLTPDSMVLRRGSVIDYRLRLHGVPLRWQSEIVEWDPPTRFVDRQRRGPYRLWEHTHTFEPLGAGTVVRDEVRYAVPGGNLVARFLVRPDLERIFDYRTRALNAWVLERLRQTDQHSLSDPS